MRTSKELYAEAPSSIFLYFEYLFRTKTAYYTLHTEHEPIERVDPVSIYDYLQSRTDKELDKCEVSYWVPTKHGWEARWYMKGRDFAERVSLREKK